MRSYSLLLAALTSLCFVSCAPKPTETAAPDDLISVLLAHKLVDEHNVNGLRQEPPYGRVIFAVPKSRFGLPIDDARRSLDFDFGIVDTAQIATPPTDGVTFNLLSVDEAGKTIQFWTRQLQPVTVPGDRGLQKASVTIPASSKQVIFETLPMGDFRNDWSYWTGLSLK